MAYRDLREFVRALEKNGELKRIAEEVYPILEIAEFAPFDGAVGELGDFEAGIDGEGDALQLVVFLERTDEFAQILIGHKLWLW